MITMEEDTNEVTSPLLTPERVAEILNVKLPKVWSMLRSKELPGIHIGREWRIEQSALNEYIRRNRNIPK